MSKPCHQLVEVRGPKGRAGPDVWQVVVGHCVLPFTHSTDGWSDKKSHTKRENNCSFSHRHAPCPWPLLALIWPCVPIEENGKPLLTWTGHILAYTDTCWHNTGYIFANFPALFSDLLDSLSIFFSSLGKKLFHMFTFAHYSSIEGRYILPRSIK